MEYIYSNNISIEHDNDRSLFFTLGTDKVKTIADMIKQKIE